MRRSRLCRPKIRPNAATPSGYSGGAPTSVMFAVASQQIDIRINVVIGRNRIKDEVEATGMFAFRLRCGKPRLHPRPGEERLPSCSAGVVNGDVRSECMGKFHAHVTQTTQADHSDLLAFGHMPVAHWGVES